MKVDYVGRSGYQSAPFKSEEQVPCLSLSLNQIQRKRESRECQSAVLAAQGVDATSGEIPRQEAGLVKRGPPSVSGKQGAWGSLPKAMKLSGHHSPHSSEGLLSLVPAQELPTCLLSTCEPRAGQARTASPQSLQ